MIEKHFFYKVYTIGSSALKRKWINLEKNLKKIFRPTPKDKYKVFASLYLFTDRHLKTCRFMKLVYKQCSIISIYRYELKLFTSMVTQSQIVSESCDRSMTTFIYFPLSLFFFWFFFTHFRTLPSFSCF